MSDEEKYESPWGKYRREMYEKSDRMWTMRREKGQAEGKKIPVAEMDTTHIQNALAMLKRNGFVAPSSIMMYLGCAGPNGEAAQDAFEREMDAAFLARVSSFIDIFEYELLLRGKREHELSKKRYRKPKK